jgi:hypothetical protein
LSKHLFWKWGIVSIVNWNNKLASGESQADGVAFDVLTNVYDLSSEQKKRLWESQFGRLQDASNDLFEIRAIMDKKYPDITPYWMDAGMKQPCKELSGDEKSYCERMPSKLAGLPAYMGYMNPMTPDQTVEFWNHLKK